MPHKKPFTNIGCPAGKHTFFRMLLMLMVAGACFQAVTTSYAGNHCGAEGDWRSKFIPDEWPPANVRNYFHSVLGKVETAYVSKACRKHDDCYSRTGAHRGRCDQQFLDNMVAECNRVYDSLVEVPIRKACHMAAEGYYEAVIRMVQKPLQKRRAQKKC